MDTTPVHEPRRVDVLSALVGTAAAFGLAVSSGLTAVVVAGLLQWATLPPWLDDALPFVVLLLGLLLCGRVASDVAGRLGPWCGLGAGVLTTAIGLAVSAVSEAHGDGIEPSAVVMAAAVVTVVIGGSAWLIHRRRVAASVPGVRMH